MTTWLHCVGASYYSQAAFIQEAMKYGITRRVSLANLKRMHYGDQVLLAMKDGASLVVFGSFLIDSLSGLSHEGMEAVRAGLDLQVIDVGGKVVKRGCGEYVEGPTYLVTFDLGVMAEALDQVEDPGKLMVGGRFQSGRLVRLKSIRHSMGFRAFDVEAFSRDLSALGPTVGDSLPVLSGHYYADVSPPPRPQTDLEDPFLRRAQEVRSYQKRVTT